MVLKKLVLSGLTAIIFSFGIFFFGCGEQSSYVPEIVGNTGAAIVKSPKLISDTVLGEKKAGSYCADYGDVPRSWKVPSSLERRWRAVVVHHTATNRGNAEIIDKWHKANNWKGVGYDFVIGNGSDSGDGEIEATFRWRRQIAGAHCGGTPNNWANEYGVGVCLVGDFTKTRPTARQLQSLTKLTKYLKQRYGISKHKIYGHRETPGYSGGTICPGPNFPMYRFKSSL